jgi:2-enoate reductase
MEKFENLFSPINIGGVKIKNRIALAPMGDFHQFFNPTEGTVNRKWLDYLIEKAKGGSGLIIPNVFKVEDKITYFRQDGLATWGVISKQSRKLYAELADYVHLYDARIFFQLSAGPGRVMGGIAIDNGFTPISVSPNQAFFRPEVTCRELAVKEIKEIVNSFGETAKLISDCGIDGVEIHGHEGYLIDQFATSLWNRRNDQYGGSLENRMKFAIEILGSIKSVLGKDFPVVYRYGSKHFIKDEKSSALRMGEKELGRDLKESIEMAKILERAGYDGLHIDTGCYESVYWAHPPIYMPRGFSLDLTSKIKNEVNIPVIAVGRLGDPSMANQTISEGKADMIALGRDLLADNYWPNKVMLGKIDEIRPCIGCHECMNRAETVRYLTCAVNPTCGNESRFKFSIVNNKKKVIIIGGGIAGMEAARVLNLKGQEVILFEKKEELGGHLISASVPDFKKDIKELLNWYKRQLQNSKTKIYLNKSFNVDEIKTLNPDLVLLATGSIPIIPKISGVDKKNVMTCIDVLLGIKQAGEEVVVVGGGIEGCETALWLAQKGKKVTIVEMLSEYITDLHRANKKMLIDLMEDNHIKVITNTKIQEISDSEVTTINNKSELSKIKCDSVVLAVGLKPIDDLYHKITQEKRLVYKIGDCKKPRKIINAVWEAFNISMNL